jgi:polar amino acid transport system ATP-binding protein/sulfate transport system ATP-binding protein
MIEYKLNEILLEVQNVSLDYDGRAVLKNVNAKIHNITRPNDTTGQIVGFLGPSGVGKTQLFRIVAGLNKPTSGRVTINGLDRDVEVGEIGVVAQNYPLFEHRTVFSNLLLAAKKKEKDAKLAKDKVITYLQEFSLGDVHQLYPAQLSGGQRQRCATIQQVLCSEHFLLMDEPFSGLDLLMLEKTCALISKIANLNDLNTIVVVTHDVTAAVSIADHIWLMGRETGTDGKKIPGARIMKEYNLIERDLCYKPGITTSATLMDFVREVKNEFRSL